MSVLTYIVDVDPDGDVLHTVDCDVVLEVHAEDLAGHHVVQNNLEIKNIVSLQLTQS